MLTRPPMLIAATPGRESIAAFDQKWATYPLLSRLESKSPCSSRLSADHLDRAGKPGAGGQLSGVGQFR